ncbi:MAG: hypothetical protein ABL932_14130, partial [Terricaulis sp.]
SLFSTLIAAPPLLSAQHPRRSPRSSQVCGAPLAAKLGLHGVHNNTTSPKEVIKIVWMISRIPAETI